MPCGASTSIQLRVYHRVSLGLKSLILLRGQYRGVLPFIRQWLHFGYIVFTPFRGPKLPLLAVAKIRGALAFFSTLKTCSRFQASRYLWMVTRRLQSGRFFSSCRSSLFRCSASSFHPPFHELFGDAQIVHIHNVISALH